MAQIEQKVRSLVAEDPDMRSAVETVLDRAEDGQVDWIDVRDELTSGQWGRLIEKEILIDGEEGFELADVEATQAALEEKTSEPETETETPVSEEIDADTSWSTWDKAAGIASLLWMVGYTWGPIRNTVGTALDAVLGPIESMLPFYVVIMILALVTGLYSTLLQAKLMDTEAMGKFQERMKDVQQRLQDAKDRGDDEAVERIQQEQMEAMGDQLNMFKIQFRPFAWIMFITIPVFLWMYWKVGIGQNGTFGSVVFPLVGEVNWKEGVAGPMQAWIVWYFLCSMGFTQIIRKGLNIDISPTGS